MDGTKPKQRGHHGDDGDVAGADDTGGGGQFQTTFGLVMSCLGCVVGTGNIWRFPRVVANNSNEKGCLVFLLIWVVFLFLWSSPMMLVEYATGRYSKKAIVGAFRSYLGEKYMWCGAFISAVTFFISGYYSVVVGWCYYYLVYCIANDLPTDAETGNTIFNQFAQESAWPVFTHFIALATASLTVWKGVKGIEWASNILVPLLLLIVIFTFIWSLTREYADLGIKFLFTPDWESFGNARVWVDALSQNAFDTGAGGGLLIPYAAYMTRRNNIVKYSAIIPAANNLVSLIIGITIFITVFSTLTLTQPYLTQSQIVAVLQDSGPASTGLTFIWIPVLFSSLGGFGRFLAILFFLSLSCAGLTSLIANVELMTHTLQDLGVVRKIGMPVSFVLVFLVGLASALDLNILTNQDFVWGFALVVNGVLFEVMIIKYGVEKYRRVCINEYSLTDWYLPKAWVWLIRIILPVEVLLIIVWWAVDLITSDHLPGERWYELGRETLVMTLLQWVVVLLIVFVVNVLWLHFRRKLHSGSYGDKKPLLPKLKPGMKKSKSAEY